MQAPDVNYDCTDAWNVLMFIVRIEGSKLYKLTNKNATLKHLCIHNQFVICKEKLFYIDEISSQEIS